jgi:hypothetical protein
MSRENYLLGYLWGVSCIAKLRRAEFTWAGFASPYNNRQRNEYQARSEDLTNDMLTVTEFGR